MRWWVNRAGQPEGPYDESRVIQMLGDGQLDPNGHVAPEGGGGWQPIVSVPALNAAPTSGVAATMAVSSQALLGGAPQAGMTPAPQAGMTPAPQPGGQSPAPSPGFSPRVAGTMAMDAASIAAMSQAGLGPAPAANFTHPSSGAGGPPSSAGGAMAPMSAPATKSKLPLILGCLVLGFLMSACVIAIAVGLYFA